MRNTQHDREGGKAVALLATCLVVLGGLISCSFVVLSSSPDPASSMWLCAACFGGIALLLWLLQEKPRDTAAARLPFLSFWRNATLSRTTQYRLQKQPPLSAIAPRPPAPPTVETIRELAQGASVWVPSSIPRHHS